MERDDSSTTLLTLEDVLKWVRERDEVRSEQARLAAIISSLEDRLRLASMLMAPDKAAQIIGELPALPKPDSEQHPTAAPARAKPAKPPTIIEGITAVLAGQKGGRSVSWIRDRLIDEPDFRERANSHSVSNSLSRMTDRGMLVRANGLYYTPKLLSDIEKGDVVEEHDSNSPPSVTHLLSLVAEGMEGWFKPADLREAAIAEPLLKEKIAANPNAVNSWLARQSDRGLLIKESGRYCVASKRDGAPTADASSAPVAGEVAPSPNNSRGGFDDLLG